MCTVCAMLGVIATLLAGGVFGWKNKYLLPSFFKLITGWKGSCDWTACSSNASTAYVNKSAHTIGFKGKMI